MNFNEHSNYEGLHAFLSASKYHWINYDDKKIAETYFNYRATVRGTELHDFAASCIKLGQKLPNSVKALNMYVNDAIGFKMKPEQVLLYSEHCFGTTDCISFRNKFLRIHDLKTGMIPGHMEQLKVYVALFCLEYRIDPKDIEIELRIYQFDQIAIENPNPDEILAICDKIVHFDKVIKKINIEEE